MPFPEHSLAPITAPESGPCGSPDLPARGNPDGLSTHDYCARLPKRRHSYTAKGRLLFFPRTEMVMVPVNMTSGGGWECVVVLGTETYRPDGYSLLVGEAEIETAVEVPVEHLPDMAMAPSAGASR